MFKKSRLKIEHVEWEEGGGFEYVPVTKTNIGIASIFQLPLVQG